MKRILNITMLLLLCIMAEAQSISPKVSPTNGGYYTGGGNSISWTMGETTIQTLQDATNILSQGFEQPEVNLLTGTITGTSFCAGSMVNVPYASTGIIAVNNIFTAQLSNAAGSFASPVNIGNQTGNSSGIINAIIPVNTPIGNGYRIRIIANAPTFIGKDNGVNISITPTLQAPTIVGPTTACVGGNITMDAGIYNTYNWSTGATTEAITIAATGIYYVTISNGGNCTAVAHHSATFLVNPTPAIVPTNLANICGGGNAILTVGSVYSTYNWSTAATTQAITINSGGTYTVTVLSTNGCTGTTSLTASSGCILPTFPATPTTNISATGGMANWIEPTCFYGFTVRISKHNANVWTNHTITPNTHYTFSGLAVNTEYDWQIQTNCNASGTINSGFSASQTFTTLLRMEDGETSTIDYAFNVYPNPTNDRVTVSFNANKEDAYTIRLMDITGRNVMHYVFTSVIGENQFQMDLSSLAKGIYMVILQNKDAVLQSKIVVQ